MLMLCWNWVSVVDVVVALPSFFQFTKPIKKFGNELPNSLVLPNELHNSIVLPT